MAQWAVQLRWLLESSMVLHLTLPIYHFISHCYNKRPWELTFSYKEAVYFLEAPGHSARVGSLWSRVVLQLNG